jgi:hypothetical protein
VSLHSTEELKHARALLDKIRDFDLEKLHVDLGKLNFTALRGQVELAKETASAITDDDIARLPTPLLGNLRSHGNELASILDTIGTWNWEALPQNQTPASARGGIVNTFQEKFASFLNAARTIALWSITHSSKLADSERRAVAVIGDAESAKLRYEQLVKEVADLKQTVAEESAKVAAVKYSGAFSTAANDFGRSANWWLLATVACATLALLFGVRSMYVSPPTGLERLLIYFLGRLVVLSTLFYSVGVCSANYRASKHNQVVNHHRSMALNTFERFTGAADADTKQTVLVTAVNAIFRHQPTGYQHQDAEQPANNTLVEVFPRVPAKKD